MHARTFVPRHHNGTQISCTNMFVNLTTQGMRVSWQGGAQAHEHWHVQVIIHTDLLNGCTLSTFACWLCGRIYLHVLHDGAATVAFRPRRPANSCA
eukprot:1136428-Pelagomonas_calceolata.AAC.7